MPFQQFLIIIQHFLYYMYKQTSKSIYLFSTSLKIKNPYTNSVILDVQAHSKQKINQKYVKLEKARQDWKQLTEQLQNKYINNYIQKIIQNRQSIIQKLTDSTGKPINDSEEQINMSILMMKSLTNDHKKKIIKNNQLERIKFYPYGNILSIFNQSLPFLHATKYIVPSLKTGNGLILNPQIEGLLISLQLEKLWKQTCQIPLVSLIATEIQGRDYLFQQIDTGYVSFSGKIQLGNKIYSQMAQHNKCFAESEFLLTSFDAAYVTQDANLQWAAKNVAKGIISHMGNIFCSIKRIYVKKQISNKFTQLLLEQLKKQKLGNPNSKDTTYSTLNLSLYPQQLQILQKLKQQHKSSIIYGGQLITNQNKNIQMTPLIIKSQSIYGNSLLTEQYPFPLAFIEQVDHDPIEQINSSKLGITLSIFTKDQNRALSIGNRAHVGVINVNIWQVEPRIPYSPRKRSGKGMSFSSLCLQYITRTKAISYV